MINSTPTPDPSTESLAELIARALPAELLASPHVSVELAARWSELHRHWHGPAHLRAMLDAFADVASPGDRDVLCLAAVYHDAIYHPRRQDNEEASARLLLGHARDPHHPVVRRAAALVDASRWSEPPADELTRRFWAADCQPLDPDLSMARRLAYEQAVFREYQWAPWPMYLAKRREFLERWSQRFPEQARGAAACLDLLASWQPRIAIYPGSFAPFHLGHLSILRQAERLFDKVIVGVAVNRQKPGAAEQLEARHRALQDQLCFHEVAAVPGLLTRWLDDFPLPLAVVRGVRDGTDLEAELRYARFLGELRPNTPVVWIACDAASQHLSSSAIRELAGLEPGTEQRYVPTTRQTYALVSS